MPFRSMSELRNRVQNANRSTVMRQQPRQSTPQRPKDPFAPILVPDRPPFIRQGNQSSSSGSSGSSVPSTPPLSSVQFVPRQIPTFDASYFMPSDTLKQMENLLNAEPNINEEQLKQRAQTQTELYTNPQIETLRQQINAFKSLIPQARQEMESAYSESREQAVRSVQDVLREAIQAAQAQPGGLRSGVATELTAQASRDASPLLQALHTDYVNTRDQVMTMLEAQQNEAQNLLRAIEENRENMTKANYDALRDQAIQQFRQAQQAQQQFMQGIAQIEAGARQSAASYQQESAAAYNEFMQQMIQEQQQNLAASNMDAWIRYLTGSDVKNRNDALRLLEQNRSQIQSAVGVEGFNQLRDYINNLGATWVNPNYVAPPSSGTSSSSSSSRSSTSSSGFRPIILNPFTNFNFSVPQQVSSPSFLGSNLVSSLLRR